MSSDFGATLILCIVLPGQYSILRSVTFIQFRFTIADLIRPAYSFTLQLRSVNYTRDESISPLGSVLYLIAVFGKKEVSYSFNHQDPDPEPRNEHQS